MQGVFIDDFSEDERINQREQLRQSGQQQRPYDESPLRAEIMPECFQNSKSEW